MRQMADDLAGLMDALSLPKAVIVGHSMGGYVTLAFAQAYPERLAGIGFVCSHSLADSPERRAARLAQAEDALLHGPKSLADSQTPKLSADHQFHAVIYRIIMRLKPAGLAGALQGMAERGDTSALLPEISVPGLVIAGLDDQLIPVERSRELASALPHAELVEISGAGHMPMLEKPDQVASALDKLVLEMNSHINEN
jgi:pimeloyl-ACP methyl ester carboxylesterase